MTALRPTPLPPSLLALTAVDDPGRIGGKAAGLAALARRGLRVPESLVIPSDVAPETWPSMAPALSAWARDRAPYGLIVRSSAPGEDGTRASFAGLLTSVFCDTAPKHISAALEAVAASMHRPEVAHYATALGLPVIETIAALIQPAIRPVTAGVLAADTPAGWLGQWRIEAVFGLPGPLLSGRVEGACYIGHGLSEYKVDRHVPVFTMDLPADIRERTVPPGEWLPVDGPAGQRAEAKLSDAASGILHLMTPAEWRSSPILTDHEIALLLEAAHSAAAILGVARVDLEWAITSDGAVTILQARPLTTPLPPSYTDRSKQTGTLRGTPASPGQARGPVVHLQSAEPNQAVAPGGVVVCERLLPVHVSSIVGKAAAIVTERGGSMSHSAILARELGIPAVTTVYDARSVLEAGALVEVDGSAGTVTHHPSSEGEQPR